MFFLELIKSLKRIFFIMMKQIISGFLYRFVILLLIGIGYSTLTSAQQEKIRVAVAGISHDHSGWILSRMEQKDIEVVGIFEKDPFLLQQKADRYHLDKKLLYTRLEDMLEKVRPQAVAAFGSIYDHLSIVQACAPRGIHVMVEKPLAVSVDHALKMNSLVRQYGIHLITNYETSWYPATAKAYQLIYDSSYTGGLRKAVFHHGHEGPVEIGTSKAFLSWLTDPVLNGGGAVIDFGCYGANLMTWLMKGQEPLSVTAVTRQFKPDIYPKVDDEATIILTYPGAQAIIEASWNWPFNRKDMELYGKTGYVITVNNRDMRIRKDREKTEQLRSYTAEDILVYENPFSYFADVVRGKIRLTPDGLYSLPNNITVVRILDAAKRSAATGKTVLLKN